MSQHAKWLKIIAINLLCCLLLAFLANRFFLELPSAFNKIVFFVIMAATGIVCGTSTAFYVRKMYIKPMVQIQEGLEYIRAKNEQGPFITIGGLNEMTELGSTLNNIFADFKNKEIELKESEKHYKYLSFYDTLTGLHNRAYFEYEMKRMSNNPHEFMPLSFISVDIDGHKIVNDTFGHNAGDKQLKFVAELLKTSIRKEDTLVRAGGDEFCIILPKVSHRVAQKRRTAILKAVEKHNSKNPFIPLSISVGVSTSENNHQNESIYDIYHRADDDMYYNKFNKSITEKGRVIDLFLSALLERDYVAQGHTERMENMAVNMAELLNISEKEKNILLLLAKLHDLGNIGIPDEILFKPSELNEEELTRVRTHVNIGYNIASRSHDLSHIAEYILYHHEWWNGSGYPTKIKGEEIPLVCRIVSILDAYDTMTNPRPYHIPKKKAEAIQELRKCAGTQFDPVLVGKFIEMISEENNILDSVSNN